MVVPGPWMSIMLYKGDIRSYLADWTPAPPLPGVGWLGSSRSPFSTEDDLAGTSVLFSPSVRRRRCSQVGQDVLRQDALVLRYAPRVILTKSGLLGTFGGGCPKGLVHRAVMPPRHI